MIDCGRDWLRHVCRVAPDAILVTHAHPDHVGGLRNGSPCPVYAPRAVWRAIERWPIPQGHQLSARRPTDVCGIRFEACALVHSVIAPAVGYRITAGTAVVFYAPDVLRIRQADDALGGTAVYVGDGATIQRPIVRVERRTGTRVGHASIAAQLDWCARAGVPRAIFTHCGRGIVAGPPDVGAYVSAMGRERGVDTRVAWDGLRVTLR
jgi:phosphoribosyl 1,2-cyclic phosphodiesterase